MSKRGRRSRSGRRRSGNAPGDLPGEFPEPLADVVDCGGQLIYAVGYTSGGAPYGPRVEIVGGELRFLDEQAPDPDDDFPL